ncbi:diphosphomevalonate decarboxylase [Nocardia sp. BMG51109]|uniref:diphosphomevalonate decarboxylase n=1 Tax=Nocardia sp. BMG51109 TaxID=1056816 RepID=UPI000465323B|nr:diphosphomevalonate decarboxylase [Nocardia sp. BMG51109]
MTVAPRPAAAVAYPNIALIKYWGKRDDVMVLPVTGSLSMTLDSYPTTTTVRPVTGSRHDTVVANGNETDGEFRRRVTRFLDIVRELANSTERAAVETVNTVPTAAGLASSAAGFAALATAATAAYGISLDRRDLSRLARRGSGSACRSIFGSFVLWRAGTGTGPDGDRSSYAEPVDTGALDPAMVLAIVDPGRKAVSTGDAMRSTMATSPLYRCWAEAGSADLVEMTAAIAKGDLARVGEIAEANALGMHATMLAARPAIRYLTPRSLSVLDRVVELRRHGIAAYATIDAGPNVKVLCARTEAPRVETAIRELDRVTTRTTLPGTGSHLVDLPDSRQEE